MSFKFLLNQQISAVSFLKIRSNFARKLIREEFTRPKVFKPKLCEFISGHEWVFNDLDSEEEIAKR